MIELTHIHDLNLISAKLHGVDLDVERCAAELERLLGAGPATPDALGSLERAVAKVLVHDWPRPHDPVVRQLRLAAAAMVDRVRRLQ
jgi:hypothetical protein